MVSNERNEKENEEDVNEEMNEEENEEEQTNVNMKNEDSDLLEAEENLEDRYMNIPQNGKDTVFILRGFDPIMRKPRVRPIQKEFKGNMVDKVHFDVIKKEDLVNGKIFDHKIRWFDIGKRSARLIHTEIKDGNQLLDIKHTGDGKDTLYIPTPCHDPRLLKAVEKVRPKFIKLQPRRIEDIEENEEDEGVASS